MTYKPTLDEYKEIGEEFTKIATRLVHLEIKVQHLCGKRYNLIQSTKTFNAVRSKLDDKVFEQYPNETIATLSAVFYGRQDEDE